MVFYYIYSEQVRTAGCIAGSLGRWAAAVAMDVRNRDDKVRRLPTSGTTYIVDDDERKKNSVVNIRTTGLLLQAI